MGIEEKVLCSKSHEFILENADGTYTVGLTDYAVDQLGDIVYLELPEVDSEFKKGETFATIESVKAASEIYMPISGKILEINESAVESPEILNEDVWEKGWLVKIEPTGDSSEQDDLLEYSTYKEELE
jgi:glycine cleavage system H protein